MNKFAERLKELRNEKGISQIKLAKFINVSDASINRWEKDLNSPSIESIIELCKFFECSSDYLIGLQDWT